MNNQTDVDTEHFRALLQEIHSLKESIPYKEDSASPNLLDSFVWLLKRLTEPPELSRRERERLQDILRRLADTHQESAQLQRSAMEVAELAPPRDAASVTALSVLLDHENIRVRTNACQALGRIGGEKVKQILKSFAEGEDPQMKQLANEALSFCIMGSLAETVRSICMEKWKLKKLMDEKYLAQTLFLCSGGFLLAFTAALVAWYSFDVVVVHPVLSFVGAVASLGFVVLSARRYKCK
jgi:hypothetical protein